MIVVRARRIAAVAAGTLMLLGVGSFSARGAETGLFGYTTCATSTAVSFLYNQPTFGVPSDPTFELRKVYSLAELDSGPSSHGLGSVLWPGQVVGNAPPSLLFDTLIFNPTQVKQLQPVLDQIKSQGSKATAGRSGYPVRAEAFYPSSKTSDAQELGAGVHENASAREDVADASSTVGGAGVQGIVSYGSSYSRSTTQVAKGLATSYSVTHITDLDLFGAIHIDSLMTTATSTSDGQTDKSDGTLELLGMTVKDQNGVQQLGIRLDKTGLHIAYPNGKREVDPLSQLTVAVNKVIGPQGFSIAVGKPVDSGCGSSPLRSLAGLTLHLDAHGMNTLLDALDKAAPSLHIKSTLRNPTSNHTIADPIFGDHGVLDPYVAGLIGSFFQGDQTMDFVFGDLAVASAASPPLAPFPIVVPPITPPVVSPAFNPGTNPVAGPITQQPQQQQQQVTQPLAIQPVAVVGIPFALLALVLAAGLIGASRLRLFADGVISAKAAARCPLEEQNR